MVLPTTSIHETIKKIDRSALQVALVVDEQNKLLGTVTDGDVRRGMLKAISLQEPVSVIMNPNPITAGPNEPSDAILAMMKRRRLHHIPVVDRAGRLVGLEVLDELLRPAPHDNVVVLMAGGRGTRLLPLTENCPKPMLQVDGKPILENILLDLIEHGFRRFYITVYYKADMIRGHFGGGGQWGVSIEYIEEDKQLGTAGALSLLQETPSVPLLVMNGDLLTKVNFQYLLDFHNGNKAKATMCIREYDIKIPYGVVEIEKQNIRGIDEKPAHRFFVNAGIYVLDPVVLELIPKNTFFNMTDIFKKLIENDYETAVFPIREHWLDIGQIDDLEKARVEYSRTSE